MHGANMGAAAAHMVVGAGVGDEPGDAVSIARFGAALPRDEGFERGPSLEAVLEGERVLDVAQGWFGGRIRDGALESRARVAVVRAKRLEPALRLPLQVLEGALRRESPGHHTFLP